MAASQGACPSVSSVENLRTRAMCSSPFSSTGKATMILSSTRALTRDPASLRSAHRQAAPVSVGMPRAITATAAEARRMYRRCALAVPAA